METVLSHYLPSFHRQAFRYLRNAADAEDAVQDALLSAYKHLGEFRGEARMSTWLTTIVANSARMRLRRRPSQSHLSLDEQPFEHEGYTLSERLSDNRPTPEDLSCSSELTAHVLQLAQRLSPTLRRAFQLRDLDGLTINEITAVLGLSEGTVKAQIARARAKIRDLMRKRLTPRRRLSSVAHRSHPSHRTL
jgi:RNA polymerase sigma-70 factor, ECF subfamily